jgi:antitoxin component of MazEF toxin-antitoxin module
MPCIQVLVWFILIAMAKELRPMVFRKLGRALVVTIPAAYVHEMGLVAGDTAFPKREPDGLHLRIVRHSKLIELANETENQLAKNGQLQEAVELSEATTESNEPEYGKNLLVG